MKDENHKVTIKKWQSIEKYKHECCTSNFVLDETFTLLGRWTNYQFASEKAHLIYSAKQINIIRPTQSDELKAIEIFGKYADHKVSFTDCISLTLMRQEKIKKIFTFDKHFSMMGCEIF